MNKHFKYGLGLIIPIALVIQVLLWIYNFFDDIVQNWLPTTLDYHWWYAFIMFIGMIIFIFIIGVIFSHFSFIRWIARKFEEWIILKIPIVKTIYKFGQEVVDSFLSDIKEDGNLKVVTVVYAGMFAPGLLTDPVNDIVFVPTVPNPMNGFIFKTKDYEIVENMTVEDFLKLIASLGRINGHKWSIRKLKNHIKKLDN